jgi:hypothetical protein
LKPIPGLLQSLKIRALGPVYVTCLTGTMVVLRQLSGLSRLKSAPNRPSLDNDDIDKGIDEGTLKTPTPNGRLYRSFLFGVVKQFCRF